MRRSSSDLYFSHYQWEVHNESNIKHEFLINNLILLKESLEELGIPLIAINTESYKTLPMDLSSFSAEAKNRSCILE